MKNISPISPLDEIVPEDNNAQENNQTVYQPPAPSQPAGPQHSAPVGQPASAEVSDGAIQAQDNIPSKPDEQPFYQESAPLYPSPLSMEERDARRNESRSSYAANKGMTISQFGIMLVAGIYALAEVLRFFKALSSASAVSALGGFGALDSYIWAVLIIGLLQSSALLYAAYKVSQGSFAGLAFISGIGMMILPQFIILYAITPELISASFRNLHTAAQFIGITGLGVMLVLAWTKERKHYA